MTGDRSHPVKVEVWSDVQCIWCYIASARFLDAVDRFDGDVEITYRSYLLQPDAPIDIDAESLRAQRDRFPAAQREQVFRQLRELAAAEGLPYEPDATRQTNSRLALELLKHAEDTGMRPQLTKRLFEAHFAEGRHVGDRDELVALAEEAGLDPVLARSALIARAHAAAVDEDLRRARDLGIQGVPFYLINDKWAISGAQPMSTFLHALRQAEEQ